MDGCNAAVEISHDDVPISATLEPMVKVLRRTDNATQLQEPLRKEKRRMRIDELLVIGK
jgi:hypothetical protein